MTVQSNDVISAGHICLDIIPQLSASQLQAHQLFSPGRLIQVGPATLALGGSVASTGIALHRLGAKAKLVGKIGDDLFGEFVCKLLNQIDPSIAENMIVDSSESTSYTIVISPPNVDRGFLHCSGANDTFTAEELNDAPLQNSRILHFGYPPLMRGTFADDGVGLANKFAEAQAAGLLVSLDMAMPSAAPFNWRRWFQNVLPHVDIFLPSLDEILLLLDPLRDTKNEPPDLYPGVDPRELATTLSELSEDLHGLGVPIVVIKLGDQGLYLSTNELRSKMSTRSAWNNVDWAHWENRELLAPCYDVDVVGTTGSGDCTIAGLLWALLHGVGPEQSLRWATAVGAHSVEGADATSWIPPWSEIQARMQTPWPRRKSSIDSYGWQHCRERQVYIGPKDTAVRFVT